MLHFHLSAVQRMTGTAALDGGLISSYGGPVPLHEFDRLDLAGVLAGRSGDRRYSALVVRAHSPPC